MRSTALIVLVALGAAACSTTSPDLGPADSVGGSDVRNVAGAPAPVTGYDWFYSLTEEEAELEYGVAETDDVPLGLSCRAGSGDLKIYAPGPSGAREIHLEAGGDNERFSASSEPSELHEGDDLYAAASTSHPVFKRFRQVGWIAIWHGERRETLVPHPASRALVDQFFAVCG